MDFPKIVIWLMLIFCFSRLIPLVLKLRKSRDVVNNNDRKETMTIPKEVLLMVFLIIAYSFLWKVIGFSLSTFGFIVATLVILRHSKLTWKKVLIAALITIGLYFLFSRAFQVSLPDPIMDVIFQ